MGTDGETGILGARAKTRHRKPQPAQGKWAPTNTKGCGKAGQADCTVFRTRAPAPVLGKRLSDVVILWGNEARWVLRQASFPTGRILSAQVGVLDAFLGFITIVRSPIGDLKKGESTGDGYEPPHKDLHSSAWTGGLPGKSTFPALQDTSVSECEFKQSLYSF